MAAAFRAAGTPTNAANSVADPTTLATTAPATRQYGDLLVLMTCCRSITATCSTPTGWTLCTGFPKTSGTASGGKIYVFMRQADGTTADNASPVWTGVTTGTSGDSSSARIHAWSGAMATQDGTPTVNDASSTTTITMPAITTAVNNSLVIGMEMKVNDTVHTVTVATRTERSDTHTTVGTGHGFAVADIVQASAGATGTATVTPSTTVASRTLAVTVAFAETVVKTTPTAEVSLASASTPTRRSSHSLKIRGRASSGVGTLRARLYENGSPITAELEASAGVTTALTTYTLNIADADAATIASYSNLSVQFRGYSAYGSAAVFEVADIYLETPQGKLAVIASHRTSRNYLLRR